MARRTEMQREVDALHAEIEKMTGRRVVSTNVLYLRNRAGDLRRRKERGDPMPHDGSGDPSAVVSASLTRSRVELLGHLAEQDGVTVSSLIKQGVDMLLRRRGLLRTTRGAE